MPDAPAESPAHNPATPNVARMYDFMLGGKENYASDRMAVSKLAAMAPGAPLNARQNRAFLGRAVRFVVSQGVTQFLDVGAGLPTQESVHEVATAIAPVARTLSVDNHPVVLSHARALLSYDARPRSSPATCASRPRSSPIRRCGSSRFRCPRLRAARRDPAFRPGRR